MRKLGRKKDNREHLYKNLTSSLVLYEKIKTTEPKAKEIKKIIDKYINIAKKSDVNSIRQLKKYFVFENIVKKIKDDLAIRFKNNNGGYTRIFRIKNRLGDNAPMVIITIANPHGIKITNTKTKQQEKNNY